MQAAKALIGFTNIFWYVLTSHQQGELGKEKLLNNGFKATKIPHNYKKVNVSWDQSGCKWSSVQLTQPCVSWAKWLLWNGLSDYKGLASFIKCSFKKGSPVLGIAICWHHNNDGFCTCRVKLGGKYRNLCCFFLLIYFGGKKKKKEHFSADRIYLVISVSLRHKVLGASSLLSVLYNCFQLFLDLFSYQVRASIWLMEGLMKS